jgi:LCP family protein required for cell wall assembly
MAAPKPRRTWPQRLTIAMLGLGALAAFGTAGGLAAGQWVISDRRIVVIERPEVNTSSGDPVVIVPGATAPPAAPPAEGPTTTTTTLPIAEPNAANFLLTGADSGDCAGSTDPTVGDRDSTRSDTIMVWRVNPDTDQVAVLSFPRDLYVEIPGRRNSRINAAYRPDDPQLLIDTIWQNFGIPIDHFIQVDFCAFRTLVDAVGGVAVPFEHPARDSSSGLNVPEAGCVTLDGNMALSYVRSRKYQWQDEQGDWHTDGTSDFGRIARQQDFLRRVLAKVISDELYRPDTIGALIETNREYLVTDDALTPGRILEFANALRTVDPAAIATYRVASRGINVGGADMQEPLLGGDNMQAILAVFRGHATLAGAPEQVFGTTVPADTAPTTVATTVPDGTGPTTSSAPLPTVVAESNTEGVAPDPLATC